MTWLEPWYSILDSADQARAMECQLLREVAIDHVLHSLPVRALARRQDRDDVLFAIEDGTGRVAVVHLTWAGTQPPRYPWTTIFSSLEAWQVDGMQADHRDYVSSGR